MINVSLNEKHLLKFWCKWNFVTMETLLQMFLKFMVLLLAVVTTSVANVQGLRPCCVTPSTCDPIACSHPPCCTRPPPSESKPWTFKSLIVYLNQSFYTLEPWIAYAKISSIRLVNKFCFSIICNFIPLTHIFFCKATL